MRRFPALSAACTAAPVVVLLLTPGIRSSLIAEQATAVVRLGSLPVKCGLPPASHPRAVFVRYPGGGFEVADRVTRATVCRSPGGLVETADGRLFGASAMLEVTVRGTGGVLVVELGTGWTVATREDKG